jgi:hypothetical protein
VTTPNAPRYSTSMAPIAAIVARISARIAVAVLRIVAVAVSVMGIAVSIAVSVMRILSVAVAVMGITARADVDINLCRCVSRCKHR